MSAALKKSGYLVDATRDGREGLWLAESNDYDVIVLDIMLPGFGRLVAPPGITPQRKEHACDLPDGEGHCGRRVNGLKAEADVYLIKPFAQKELLARLEASCRRAYGHKQARLKVADLEIDTGAKEVSGPARP